MLKQLPSIPPPPRTRFRPQVQQIPSLLVSLPQDRDLGIMQDGDEIVIPPVSLGRELELEAPEPAAEDGPPAV